MYIFNPKPFRVGRLFQRNVIVSRSDVVIQSFALIALYQEHLTGGLLCLQAGYDWSIYL